MSFVRRVGVNGQYLEEYTAKYAYDLKEKIDRDWRGRFPECRIADISISRDDLYLWAYVVYEEV